MSDEVYPAAANDLIKYALTAANSYRDIASSNDAAEDREDLATIRNSRDHIDATLAVFERLSAGREEAYSLAIVLQEEGLSGRCRIYATDVNEEVLQQARDGVYELRDVRNFTRNYQAAGGRASFADYYSAHYERALLAPQLRRDIVFAAHNLVVDASFGEMQLILCRNVLIYFSHELAERVLQLLRGSLARDGYLALGQRESIERRLVAPCYAQVAPSLALYRKCVRRSEASSASATAPSAARTSRPRR